MVKHQFTVPEITMSTPFLNILFKLFLELCILMIRDTKLTVTDVIAFMKNITDLGSIWVVFKCFRWV